MNWIIDDNGQAEFTDEQRLWRIRCEPARPEAGLRIVRAADASGAEAVLPTVRLLPPPEQRFPPLAEVYSRGSDLIANLPQTAETDFGLSLCQRVVWATAELLVCESVLAVQTELLDSHPTLDLVCDATDSHLEAIATVGDPSGDAALIHAAQEFRPTAPPTATRIEEPDGSGVTILLLPPSDRAVAEDRGGVSRAAAGPPICYRLLAEFLEKGVIRKARYWTCHWRGGPSNAAIAELYGRLMDIPLPLTP